MSIKRIKYVLIIILTILMTFCFIALRKSDRLKIDKVEIIADDDKIPQSIYEYLESIKGQNILFLNKNRVETNIKNNSLIESIQIKREFPKKLIIYLKKSQVNGILLYNDAKMGYAILVDNKVLKINSEDVDSLSKDLLVVECNEDSLKSLLNNDDISLFSQQFNILSDNYHLISNVYYSNRENVNDGFFDVSLNGINATLRFRETFDETEFKTALKLANTLVSSHNGENNIILDVYHGAIVERQK